MHVGGAQISEKVSTFIGGIEKNIEKAKTWAKTLSEQATIERSKTISHDIEEILSSESVNWKDINCLIEEYKEVYKGASDAGKKLLRTKLLALGITINSALIVQAVYEQDQTIIDGFGENSKAKVLFLLSSAKNASDNIKGQWKNHFSDKAATTFAPEFLAGVMNVIVGSEPEKVDKQATFAFILNVEGKLIIEQEKTPKRKNGIASKPPECMELYNILSLSKQVCTPLLEAQKKIFGQLCNCQKTFSSLFSCFNVKLDGYVKNLISVSDNENLKVALEFIFFTRSEKASVEQKNLSDSTLKLLIQDKEDLLRPCIAKANVKSIYHYLLNDQKYWKCSLVKAFLPILITSGKILDLLSRYNIEVNFTEGCICKLPCNFLEAFFALNAKTHEDKFEEINNLISGSYINKIDGNINDINLHFLVKILKRLYKNQEKRDLYAKAYHQSLNALVLEGAHSKADYDKLVEYFQTSDVVEVVRYVDVMCEIGKLPDTIKFKKKDIKAETFLLETYLSEAIKGDRFHFGIVYMINKGILTHEECQKRSINLHAIKGLIAKGNGANGVWLKQDGRENAYNTVKGWGQALISPNISFTASSPPLSHHSRAGSTTSAASTDTDRSGSFYHKEKPLEGKGLVIGVIIGLMVCSATTGVLFQQQILQKLTMSSFAGYLLLCTGVILFCAGIGLFVDAKRQVPTRIEGVSNPYNVFDPVHQVAV